MMDASRTQEHFPLHEKHAPFKLKALLERNRCLLETMPINIKYWFRILKSNFCQKASFLSWNISELNVINMILYRVQQNVEGLKLQMLKTIISLCLWYLFLKILLLKSQKSLSMYDDMGQLTKRTDKWYFWDNKALSGPRLKPLLPCASLHFKNNQIHQAD